jgi:heat shock protein HslJ
MRFAPILAMALAFALGSCKTAQPGQWSLAGTTWRIVALDGAMPVQPVKARLDFPDDHKMTASVGCNTIAGGYSIEDGRLMARSLVSSLIGCEGELAQEEAALNALLSAAPQVSHHGDHLQLDSGGHTLELEKAG